LLGRPASHLVTACLRRLSRTGFVRTSDFLARGATLSLQGCVVVLAVYGGLLWLTYGQFRDTPKGFIPAQDMGFLMVSVQLPDSASLERTERVMRRLQQMALDNPAVQHA